MEDVTRRQAVKLAATAGVISSGAVVFGTAQARANEDDPKDIGEREPVAPEEKERLRRAAAESREQQLPYKWEPGVIVLSGIVHFPQPDPQTTYTDGGVTGLINGIY